MAQRPELGDPGVKGFLQLCSDRRFHLKIMEAFEDAADVDSDQYYIEARPGGAPSWADTTRLGRFAYRSGASFMGWAAHGDRCLGFYGATNDELLHKLERTVQRRIGDFPRAAHFLLFGLSEEVEVRRVGAMSAASL